MARANNIGRAKKAGNNRKPGPNKKSPKSNAWPPSKFFKLFLAIYCLLFLVIAIHKFYYSKAARATAPIPQI